MDGYIYTVSVVLLSLERYFCIRAYIHIYAKYKILIHVNGRGSHLMWIECMVLCG